MRHRAPCVRRAIRPGEEVGEVQWNRSAKNQSVGVNQSNPQRQSQPFELPVLPDGSNNPALARQQTPQRRATAAPNLVGTLGGDGLLSRATAASAGSPSLASSSAS